MELVETGAHEISIKIAKSDNRLLCLAKSRNLYSGCIKLFQFWRIKMNTRNPNSQKNGWRVFALLLGYVGSFLCVSFWVVRFAIGMAYNPNLLSELSLDFFCLC